VTQLPTAGGWQDCLKPFKDVDDPRAMMQHFLLSASKSLDKTDGKVLQDLLRFNSLSDGALLCFIGSRTTRKSRIRHTMSLLMSSLDLQLVAHMLTR
jgi:hypothetical protein